MAVKQEAINQLMLDKGKSQYRKNRQRLKESHLESLTSAGVRLSALSVKGVADEIERKIQYYKSGKSGFVPSWLKYTEYLPPVVLAWIGIRGVLDHISVTIPYNVVIDMIADNLYVEHSARKLKALHPDKWKEAHDKVKKAKRQSIRQHIRQCIRVSSKGVNFDRWDRDTQIQLAAWVLDMVRVKTGFIRRIYDETKLYLAPTPEMEAWIEKHHAKAELYRPSFMPMVEPPIPWTSMTDGGYPSLIQRSTLVTRSGKGGKLSLADVGELPLKAINRLQDVPYRINKTMLEVVQWAYTKDIEIGKLSRNNAIEIPLRSDWAELSEEEKKQVKRDRHDMHNKNRKVQMESARTMLVLNQTNVIKDSTVYFPLTMDFRGRIYMKPNSPQGVDFQRCLYEYADGIKVGGGIDWLAIHGANQWGIRGTKQERIAWVQENSTRIADCAMNPYDCKWWHDAGKPWSFLAFCLEWKGVLDKGTDYVSHIPVQMDGSCNGAQILSLILADVNLATLCNVLPSDRPQCIYEYASEKVIKILKSDDTLKYRHGWLRIGINRDVVKPIVMNLPYGLSLYGGASSLVHYYAKHVEAGGQELFRGEAMEAAKELLYVIKASIGFMLDSTEALRSALWGMVNWQVKHERPIRFTSPSGFTVVQDYRKPEFRKVKTIFDGSTITFSEAYQSMQPDGKKSRHAIMANLIHAHDAGILHHVVNNADLKHLTTIHDCYATHACNAEHLNKTIRDTVSDLYVGKDHLTKLENETNFYLNRSELPIRRSLEGVADSEYMFS